MVVVVPILLGVPPAFVRVIPRMMAAPAFPTLGAEVLAGVAGLRTPFSVARNGALEFLLSFLDVVLTLGAIFVGSRRSGASTQKNGVQCCAGECDFSVLCIQDFPPGACSPSTVQSALAPTQELHLRQSYTCARSPLRFSDLSFRLRRIVLSRHKKAPPLPRKRQNGASGFAGSEFTSEQLP